jgi:hypothetical protein
MDKKEPQDHKSAAGPVTFKTSAGKLTLPHPTSIPSGVIRRTRKMEDAVDQFFGLLEGIFGEDSDEMVLCDKLTMEELGALFTEWMQGASLGESSGSSI